MLYAYTRDEDRHSLILDSLEEGILLIEANGQIIYANHSMVSILGISEESIIGRCLSELPINILVCLGLTREDAESLIKHLRQDDFSFIEKFESIFNNPIKRQTLQRKALPFRYQTKHPRGLLLVLYDVTKEQQIAQARDIFSETIIHDLRSPISATLGSLDVLQDFIEGEGHNELAQQALRIARNGAKRVLNLVEAMLDVIRMQSGRLNLNPSQLDLNALIDQIILDFQHQSQQYGITLRNEASQGLPKINADQGKLQRVMNNLVENALKFTPRGGEVVVKTEISNSGIIVHVEDSGLGIPDEYREKIFERFVQVPDQVGRQQGIGLGLTFCRLVIEAHRGKIWADSRPGGGSIFSFFLPLNLFESGDNTSANSQ